MKGSKGPMDKRQWKKIEDDFRMWSFHVYYKRVFKNEHDPVVRFIKALKASVQPIRDRALVMEWYRWRKEHEVRLRKEEDYEAQGC